MKFPVTQYGAHSVLPLSLRCPHCGKETLMSWPGGQDIHIGGNIICGQRVCPNSECKGHVFVVHSNGKLITSYPPSTIDFDPAGIPVNIVASIDEAIRCHAIGCFTASALLVRRTLEEVCLDKGATGNDLKARITDLKSKVMIPNELFEAMNELRLLGNDAAHVEAKSYDKVSSEEIEVAIAFAKELLKALYQYSNLLSRLRSLKKPLS